MKLTQRHNREQAMLNIFSSDSSPECKRCGGQGYAFVANTNIYFKDGRLIIEVCWFCGSCAEGWKQTVSIALGDVISNEIDLDGYHD